MSCAKEMHNLLPSDELFPDKFLALSNLAWISCLKLPRSFMIQFYFSSKFEVEKNRQPNQIMWKIPSSCMLALEKDIRSLSLLSPGVK